MDFNLKLIIMKNCICLIFLISLLATLSCNRATDSISTQNLMTKSDSLQIVSKVLEITDAFASANNSLDANKIMEYWHYKDSNFIIIENTTIYQAGEELFKAVQDFYKAGIDSTCFIWKKREIIPLSLDFAHLYAEYQFYLKLNSGEITDGPGYYSALFKKINGNWRALRVHESYDMGSK